MNLVAVGEAIIKKHYLSTWTNLHTGNLVVDDISVHHSTINVLLSVLG